MTQQELLHGYLQKMAEISRSSAVRLLKIMREMSDRVGATIHDFNEPLASNARRTGIGMHMPEPRDTRSVESTRDLFKNLKAVQDQRGQTLLNPADRKQIARLVALNNISSYQPQNILNNPLGTLDDNAVANYLTTKRRMLWGMSDSLKPIDDAVLNKRFRGSDKIQLDGSPSFRENGVAGVEEVAATTPGKAPKPVVEKTYTQKELDDLLDAKSRQIRTIQEQSDEVKRSVQAAEKELTAKKLEALENDNKRIQAWRNEEAGRLREAEKGNKELQDKHKSLSEEAEKLRSGEKGMKKQISDAETALDEAHVFKVKAFLAGAAGVPVVGGAGYLARKYQDEHNKKSLGKEASSLNTGKMAKELHRLLIPFLQQEYGLTAEEALKHIPSYESFGKGVVKRYSPPDFNTLKDRANFVLKELPKNIESELQQSVSDNRAAIAKKLKRMIGDGNAAYSGIDHKYVDYTTPSLRAAMVAAERPPSTLDTHLHEIGHGVTVEKRIKATKGGSEKSLGAPFEYTNYKVSPKDVLKKSPKKGISDKGKQSALDYDRALEKKQTKGDYYSDAANGMRERAADSFGAHFRAWAAKNPETAKAVEMLEKRFEGASLRRNFQLRRKGMVGDIAFEGAPEDIKRILKVPRQTPEEMMQHHQKPLKKYKDQAEVLFQDSKKKLRQQFDDQIALLKAGQK